MTCVKCGHEFNGNFCPSCGHAAGSTYEYTTDSTGQDGNSRFAPGWRGIFGKVCFVMVVLCAFITLIAFALSSFGPAPIRAALNSVPSDKADAILVTGNQSAFTRPDPTQITTIDYRALYDNAANYNGGYVRIAGRVSSAGENITGTSYVTFRDGFSGITNCIYINLGAGLDSTLFNQGDMVVFIGKVGSSVTGTLNIDDSYVDDSVESPSDLHYALASSYFDIEVTATDLLAAYDANEVSADNQYGSKVLKVTGAIGSIGKDIVDEVYITLVGSTPYSLVSVQCYFSRDAEISMVAGLEKGETITVVGTCDGASLNILMKDCFVAT